MIVNRIKRTYRGSLHSFFAWCMHMKNLDANPTDAITVPKMDESLPGILSVVQVTALLETALKTLPELCAYLTLGFFAGLRPAELMRLTWDAVND